MSRYVPYLAEEAIERDAAALLAEYEHARGVMIEPPIPIEDIVEKHLKLGIEFDDTHRLFGIPGTGLDLGQGPDILGAIFFDEKRVVVDEGLDPEENPNKEGRYRFTLAHEAAARAASGPLRDIGGIPDGKLGRRSRAGGAAGARRPAYSQTTPSLSPSRMKR